MTSSRMRLLRAGQTWGGGRARLACVLSVVVAVTGVLSGCASIPTSGGPNHVSDIDTDATGGYIITPAGPASGDSQEEILRGFIDAGTGFSNDYAVAREYLTSDLKSTWDPSASVLVYDGQPTISIGQDGKADVSVSVGASIDQDGHLTETSTNADVKQTFTLVQVSGEWRIASAPDGVAIIRPRFSLIYTQQTLYFYDPDFAFRVPDVRWIANTPWAATRLVQLLLKGPSSWLAKGTVATAVPDGTQLAVDTISTSSSVTTVELSSQALTADARGRQLMLLQLQATLSGLSTVSKVQISVNDTVVPISDLGSDAPITNPSPQAARLIVDDGESLAYLSDDGTTEKIAGLADAISQLPLTSFTIRGSTAAGTTAQGLWIATGDADAPTQLTQSSSSGVSIDPHGYVWAVVGQRVKVFGPDGSETSVAQSWLGDDVISAKLSRDGTRLAILARNGSRVSVLVSGLVRDKEGKPSELVQPLTLTTLDRGASAIVWSSDQDVAILASAGNASTVTVMTVGGESTTKTSTAKAIAMTAGSGEDSIRLLLESGEVFAPRGSSWLQVATGISAIGYSW